MIFTNPINENLKFKFQITFVDNDHEKLSSIESLFNINPTCNAIPYEKLKENQKKIDENQINETHHDINEIENEDFHNDNLTFDKKSKKPGGFGFLSGLIAKNPELTSAILENDPQYEELLVSNIRLKNNNKIITNCKRMKLKKKVKVKEKIFTREGNFKILLEILYDLLIFYFLKNLDIHLVKFQLICLI